MKKDAVDFITRETALRKRDELKPANMIARLRKRGWTTKQLCDDIHATEREVMDAILRVQGHGYLLSQFGDEWRMQKDPQPTHEPAVYRSRRNGTYCFGFSSDQHLGSKYERLDVLEDLYDKFAERGVDRVFNCGNWIEGESSKNRHDIQVYGMDAQCEYLVERYPRRAGIKTYVIAGDDHEGWYCQREQVDIGQYAAGKFKTAKRTDWVYLGYMEAFVELKHAATGSSAMLLLMHPGGGSSYADSYRPQKIVEGFSGGEKPAGLLLGHYHKMGYYPIRNVHVIQTGCTQDQSTWSRKKGLSVHVGGGVCEMKQDEQTGAIIGCKVEFFPYYNEDYYQNRWNPAGKVNLPPRPCSTRD